MDVTNRLLTVIGPQGYPQVFVVGPTVEHIEKIKVKEKVTIAYQQEVAMALRKFDGPPINKDEAIVREEEAGMDMNAPTVAEQDSVEATPKGASDLTTIEVSDTVAAINHNKRTITFAGTAREDAHDRGGPERTGLQSDPGRRPDRAARDKGSRRQRDDHLIVAPDARNSL